ncbi:MAG: methyltransferase domain-containing protein, partial [Bdellovibrio sp.]
QMAEDYGDDYLQFSGQRHKIPDWYSQTEKVWEDLYQNQSTPWDLGGPAPAFVDLLPRLRLPRQRVLVMGCGEGHDAIFFAEAGHRVTAVDLSLTALQRARQRDVHSLVEWRCEDAFQTPGVFDLVVEHTFFAALPPGRRPDLVRLWRQKLNGDGFLMGLFFAMPKRDGPPFGGSEWELQKRLGNRFQPLVWHRTLLSPPDRMGKEFLVYGRFLPTGV